MIHCATRLCRQRPSIKQGLLTRVLRAYYLSSEALSLKTNVGVVTAVDLLTTFTAKACGGQGGNIVRDTKNTDYQLVIDVVRWLHNKLNGMSWVL